MVILKTFDIPTKEPDEPPGDGLSASARASDARAASAADMLVTPRCPRCRQQLAPRVVAGTPAWCCPCSHAEEAARRTGEWVTTGIDLPADDATVASPRQYLLPEPASPRMRRLLAAVK